MKVQYETYVEMSTIGPHSQTGKYNTVIRLKFLRDTVTSYCQIGNL